MDVAHLFAAKVVRPPPSGLRRRRLRERVLDSTSGVVSVVAPAGAGKTTLLAQAADTVAPGVGWYRAGPEDGDPALFARYVARALGDLLPDAARVEDVDTLLQALEGAPPALLVLDDLQEIEGSPAEAALERLLDLRPAGLRLALVSRRPLELDLSRLLVAGDLVEVGGDDLRFRSWEVEELFSVVYGEPLPPASAAVLSRRTEGWAAGLQLFHLATVGKDPEDRERVLTSLSAQARLARPYLARNVLAELSREERDFLVRTAVLGRLTGPLCDSLLGAAGSDAVLRDLERRQLFTAAVGDGTSFRYHQVLRSHLELALVDDLGADGAREWNARAARLLEDAGAPQEALLAYARAEQDEQVARLAAQRGPHLAAASDSSWSELLLPRLWRSEPFLALAQAHRQVREGALAEAVEALRIAERLFVEPGARARTQRERRVVSAWLDTAEPSGARTGAQHWAEVLRRATQGAPPPEGSIDPLAAGLVQLVTGRFRDASRLLGPVASGAGGRDARAVAGLALTVSDLVQGRLEHPGDRLELAAQLAERRGQPWLAAAASAVRAAVVVDRLDVPAPAGPWGHALAGLLSAVVDLRCGRDATEPLARVRQELDALGAPVLVVWLVALEALAHASAGTPDARRDAAAAESACRALGVRGGQAVALSALARAGPARAQQYQNEADRVAAECGLRLDLLLGGAAAARPVRIRLFAGLRLEVEGEPLDLSGLRPRARALLRVLAASHGVDLHRERLVDTLWPDADLPSGLRSLQVAVSSIRQVLEAAGVPGTGLARHGEAYCLAVPSATVDLIEHAAALDEGARAHARGDLERAVRAHRCAVELHQADLLPEEGSAEWVVPQREQLRTRTAAAAEALAADCAALGSREEAVFAARRAVELDPYRDAAWRLLARMQDELDDVGAAARTRAEHARALAALGVDVLPAQRLARLNPAPRPSGAARGPA